MLRNSPCKDLTVLFLTDGQPDNKKTAEKELNKLNKLVKDQSKEIRYFCIGISNEHDAKILNLISRSGTDWGNFAYIDRKSKTQCEEIRTEIIRLFDIFPKIDSFKATFSNKVVVRFDKNEGHY